MAGPSVDRSPGGDLLPRVFFSTWGIGVAFHQFWLQLWVSTPLDAALTALALLVAFNPSSTALFTIFALTHVARILAILPYAWNHEILALVVQLQFLVAALAVAARTRAMPAMGDVFRVFAPAARLAYVTVYFFTAFHKLNTTFLFDTGISCGTHFYNIFVENYPSLRLPGALAPEVIAIAVTIASEALIPLLLIPARVRPIGVLWAAAFHTLVGATNNTDFNTLAFSMLTLFMAPAFLETLGARVRARLRRRAGTWHPALRVMNAVVPIVLVVVLAYAVPGSRAAFQAVQLAWLPFAFGFVAVQIAGVVYSRRPHREGSHAFRPVLWPQLAVHAILLFAGLSPYVGLRTEGSFAMFSNLRTEAGRSNHLLMPAVPLFDYQTDLVDVIDTDDPGLLQRTNQRTRRLVFYEFQKYLRERVREGQEITVCYRWRDRRIGPLPARAVIAHLPEPNLLERKLLWFRSVPREDRHDYCQH